MNKNEELKIFDLDESVENEICTAVKQFIAEEGIEREEESAITSSGCIKSAASEKVTEFINEITKKFEYALNVPKCLKFCSRQGCQFEIPADIKKLEKFSSLSYLQNYCIVKKNKSLIYKKYFDYFKNGTYIKSKSLLDIFSYVFGCEINEERTKIFFKMLDLNQDINIDFNTFVVLTAFMERILSVDFRNTLFGDSRHNIEILEFSSLNLKLLDIKIAPNLKALLYFIESS